MYAVCPDFVDAGIIHIVTPPRYGLKPPGKSKHKETIYLRDKDEVNIWMIANEYYPKLDIGIRYRGVDRTRSLPVAEYTAFVKLVLKIGEVIENVANELVLDPLILETLTYITGYLHPSKINLQVIQDITGADKVEYDSNSHILFLSSGRKDYTIPLHDVCKRLYATVLPLLNTLDWTKLSIHITTRTMPDMRDQPVSLMQLYTMLDGIARGYEVEMFKGIGQMDTKDRYMTCMHEEGRRGNIHQIKSVGDVSRIFQLLGGDSDYRKKLIRKELY